MVLLLLGPVANAILFGYQLNAAIQSIYHSSIQTNSSSQTSNQFTSHYTIAIEAATTVFLSSKLSTMMVASKALKNLPKNFHTNAFNATQSSKIFRRGAWQGDGILKPITTNYIMKNITEKSLKELEKLRSTMLSKKVHADIAKNMNIVEKSAPKEFSARAFKFYAQTICDTKGYNAVQKWYNVVIGPQCEKIAQAMKK